MLVQADATFADFGVDPSQAWPVGAEWEVFYGYARRPSRERPDTFIRHLPDAVSAWSLLCELLKRSCICGEISISFIAFTPALVQVSQSASKLLFNAFV